MKNGQRGLHHFLEAGDVPFTLYEMARLYLYGTDGVPHDVEKANELYTRAKALGAFFSSSPMKLNRTIQ
jgi:TPR repeat protein